MENSTKMHLLELSTMMYVVRNKIKCIRPREYERRYCLISILSADGYFYLEPRTLQVLFCPCVLTVRDKLSEYFLKRQAPNRTRPKPEFRESCSWVLFAWIWFRTDYEIWSDIWTQRRGLNEIRLTLANWIHSVMILFVNAFKIYSS